MSKSVECLGLALCCNLAEHFQRLFEQGFNPTFSIPEDMSHVVSVTRERRFVSSARMVSRVPCHDNHRDQTLSRIV